MNHLNSLLTALKAKGLNAQTVPVGADSHWNVFEVAPDDALIVDIYGGMAAGIIYEKGQEGYKNTLGKRRDCIVYIFSHPTMPLITNRPWLNRDSQDNYSPANFKGIEHPDEYLETQGVSYIEDVTFTNNLNQIVDFIAEQSQLVGLIFTEQQVEVGIANCNTFYKAKNRLPLTVTIGKTTISFEDFTRLVEYYGLNYDFLQYDTVNITNPPATEV
jgi:hypothetical protein